MKNTTTSEITKCYHCGEQCDNKSIAIDDKIFCCNGCKVVFEILSENNLCTYYDLENNPGNTNTTPLFKEKFSFLDDHSVAAELLEFSDNGISKVTFYIPSMHCSSCIWLLEKLYRLNPYITNSRVNFVKKEVSVTFRDREISLRKIAELLTSIGYEPQINLSDLEKKHQVHSHKKLYAKLALAGFAFGNSMLFSIPDYIDFSAGLTQNFKTVFSVLNILLSVPVLFYSASDFFISSYKGLRKKILNIDVPIAIGILALMLRSLFEVLSQSGGGYFDSFNGLIFFLLLGRLFQEKTYATMSFERDYKSYFPASVTVIENDIQSVIPVSKINIGDTILLRNQELIPADALLLSDSASIDYSFVTGESEIVEKHKNEMLYAGGRLSGSNIQIKIIKKVSQSYLTKLWNNDIFQKNKKQNLSELSDKVAQYFTIAVLLIASVSGGYWMTIDWKIAINVISSVLIVACPCALALSIPFSFGNALRIFGKNKFYLKNIQTIERIKSINHIVFDKTGTLTWKQKPEITFSQKLSNDEQKWVKTLAQNSVHPLSRYLFDHLDVETSGDIKDFVEISGKGMLARIDDHEVQLGSASWLDHDEILRDNKASNVHVAIDGNYKGYFSIVNSYRPGLRSILKTLGSKYKIALISGDNSREKEIFEKIFEDQGIEGTIKFNQSPYDKQAYVLRLQAAGDRTLMIGDGLNDAGALKQSDLGISISEDINAFSPACDAIIDASQFKKIPMFLKYAETSYNIVIVSFILSFLYNIIGLYFAVSGSLSPLIAAVLMPLSSISVVAFSTISTRLIAKKTGL
ncbi:MAG: heavy metal translocating P-type ATPase metal-binding domain-containing protein [Calditrichae bacterium]|nr:heavy metal translocating P-type ATPase metal-binding domain-containing protein [Calditrichota bacterium]MCB9057593.1 heavy metal translocating P-type ATPase metal-binding domain-containing protein [Calditrichia bacterium]